MSLDAPALAADLLRAAAGARQWLDGPHAAPLADARRAELAATIDDVAARARQWAAEPALLVVAFLGGTGVGKSTLLNALAGAAVADAGLMRPTTRFATVYLHEDVPPARLDPRLRECRTVPHRRAELRDKVLVDTPDLDGNVPEHHARLKALLPAADAAVYVGSQEKYHDRLAWEVLLEHRRVRAFAFVLNKWDRCQPGSGDRAGKMPDEDFRASLVAAGFPKAKLFRTAAGQWALRRLHQQEPDDPVPDDFPALEQWLDAGLSARMVEGIKANGLTGRTEELAARLDAAAPADWTERVRKLREAWDGAVREAARLQAAALADAGDRQARRFDGHFRSYERRDFGGLFGAYLGIVALVLRLRQGLRPGGAASAAADAAVDALGDATRSATPLDEWARRCVADTPADTRTARAEDLRRRLLALADGQGIPVSAAEACLPPLDASPTAAYDALRAEAADIERSLAAADGPRGQVRSGFAWAARWLPWAAGAAVLLKWLWELCFVPGTPFITLTPFFFAALAMLAALAGLHFALVRLRQSLNYCLKNEEWAAKTFAGPRTLLPKLMDQHRLETREVGRRDPGAAWVDSFAALLFAATPAAAAEAAAAALADGIAPDAVFEAVAQAACELVLRDQGRHGKEISAGKPAGSTHGDSIGVHASDSANAWRQLAAAAERKHRFAATILGAYQVAFDRGHRGGDFAHWQPHPLPERLAEIKDTDSRKMLGALDEAVRGGDQARAAALAARSAEVADNADGVFRVLRQRAIAQDGALHAEKYYRTAQTAYQAARPAGRGRHLAALARVLASGSANPAPGLAQAAALLGERA